MSRLLFSSLQFSGPASLYPHLGSGGSPGESNIQAGPECSGPIVLVLHVEHGAVNVVVALVDSVQLELLEDSPSQQQAGAVSSSIVGEPNLDSVPDRAMRVLAGGGGEVKRIVWSVFTWPPHREGPMVMIE